MPSLDFSRLSYLFDAAQKQHSLAIPHGHRQQLLAAACGYKSLAAAQSASEPIVFPQAHELLASRRYPPILPGLRELPQNLLEDPFSKGVGFPNITNVVLDTALLGERSVSLGYADAIASIQFAIGHAFGRNGMRVHSSYANFQAWCHAYCASEAVAAAIPRVAMMVHAESADHLNVRVSRTWMQGADRVADPTSTETTTSTQIRFASEHELSDDVPFGAVVKVCGRFFVERSRDRFFTVSPVCLTAVQRDYTQINERRNARGQLLLDRARQYYGARFDEQMERLKATAADWAHERIYNDPMYFLFAPESAEVPVPKDHNVLVVDEPYFRHPPGVEGDFRRPIVHPARTR